MRKSITFLFTLLLSFTQAITLNAENVDLSTDGGLNVSDAPNEDGAWANNTRWYKIKINGNRYWSIGGEYTDGNRFLTLTNTTAPNDPNALWCIVGNATTGYRFYNMSAGTGFVLGTIGQDAAAAQTRMVSLSDTEGRTTYFDFEHRTYSGSESNWCIKDHGTSTMYLNFRNPWLAHWNSNNAKTNSGTGSEVIFEAVNEASAISILQSYKTTILDYLQRWQNVTAVWSDAASVYNTLNSDVSITSATMASAISTAANAFFNAVNNKRVTLKTLSTSGNRNNKYMSIGTTQCLGEDASTLNQVITLKANFDFSIKLYGEANQKFVNHGTASEAKDAKCYYIQTSSSATSATSNVVAFKFQTTGILHMQNSGSNFVFTNWVKTDGTNFDDGASRWTVSTDLATHINAAKAPLANAITFYEGNWLGDGLGKYTYTPASEELNATNVYNSAKTYKESTDDNQTINISNTNGLGFAYTAAKALLNASINQPTAGKVYRFKCVGGNKYISSDVNTSSLLQMITTSGINTCFYLNESNQLLSYKTGQYIGNMSGANMKLYDVGATTMNSIAFSDVFALTSNTSYLGSYGLFVNGTSRYLYGANANIDSSSRSGGINDCPTDNRYHWTIEEVTELPVVINSTYKLGTLYSPVPLVADESKLKFFTGKIDEEGYVTLTKHSGNIPAKTPFLIELQEGATYDSTNGGVLMTVADNADAVEPSTYSMQGNLETTAYSAPENESEITIYTLQVPSDPSTATTSLVFRKFNGTKLQGCRAYLNTGGTAVKGMRFKEDVETGINSIGTQQSTANTVFDLSGRRVQNAGKGLYIVNGKKMFIK